jgi:dihydropteroate synthase
MGNKITDFNEIKSIRINNNRSLCFTTPKVMGILNLTPDSFYDGDTYNNSDKILLRVENMLKEGADIIDIGSVSTRPGADTIDVEIELSRLINSVELIIKKFPEAIISIDTYRSKVAEELAAIGAHMINDISGGTFDNNMFKTIAKLNIPYILMHINGTPQNMQNNPIESSILLTLKSFFSTQIKSLEKEGFNKIILDPGIGFGKSVGSNYEIIKNLEDLRFNNYPLMVGASRKSMINKVLDTDPSEALAGTISLNTMALINGANIIRVHDVREAKQVISIVKEYNKSNN